MLKIIPTVKTVHINLGGISQSISSTISTKCRIEDGRFFCDMNEERWETLKQKINHKFKEETWLTIDQRANRNKAWFNIMIRKF